uniref:Uncharacterized protein n=1 Tax=Anguilla anguilla TaxID=7936 RepID=A0A0E9RHG6_ANGAN
MFYIFIFVSLKRVERDLGGQLTTEKIAFHSCSTYPPTPRRFVLHERHLNS